MRSTLAVLVVVVSFNLSACDNGPDSHAKAVVSETKPQDVLVGRWEVKDEHWFKPHIQGYEFAADQTAKLLLLGRTRPLPAKYHFIDDYTLELEYDRTDDTCDEYSRAVRGCMRSIRHTSALPTSEYGLDRIPTELPAKEKLTISLRTLGKGIMGGGLATKYEMVIENEKEFSLVYRKTE
jgi:hypothetical protein